MIRLRLSKTGTKNKHFFRIVATDSAKKNKGKYLDVLGHWSPINKDLLINKDKLNKWVSKGARISHALERLISK